MMAAVDHVIGRSASPTRTGSAWAAGATAGILTNYVITKTTRFKAAISGASETNYLANYGTDHYQYEWEAELGLPWKNPELWGALSPWFQVEKVTTPTLFLCGADDVNVPLLNSEQIYQALTPPRRRDRARDLSGPGHRIRTPSYRRTASSATWPGTTATCGPGRRANGRAEAETKPEATSLWGVRSSRPRSPPSGRSRSSQPREGHGRVREEPGRRRDHLAGTAHGVPGPVPRRDRHLHPRPRAAPARRAAAAPPRPPLHHRARARQGHRRPRARRGAERPNKDEVEPDGEPNARTTHLHFNVWYHLGLAHYLKGDFAGAERAYRRCLEVSRDNADRVAAASDWLYMTLRRLGRESEAARVLEPIRRHERHREPRYLNRLLMYKGENTPEELRAPAATPSRGDLRIRGRQLAPRERPHRRGARPLRAGHRRRPVGRVRVHRLRGGAGPNGGSGGQSHPEQGKRATAPWPGVMLDSLEESLLRDPVQVLLPAQVELPVHHHRVRRRSRPRACSSRAPGAPAPPPAPRSFPHDPRRRRGRPPPPGTRRRSARRRPAPP